MEGIYRYRFQGTILVEREGFLSSSDVGLSAHYSVFYDLDHPVQSANRKRLIAAATFEHKYLNASGWTIWATPKTTVGLAGLFRYDDVKPNKDVSAQKKRTLLGVAYWFKAPKAGLATAVLADYENVKYGAALNKPQEKRLELKTLVNF